MNNYSTLLSLQCLQAFNQALYRIVWGTRNFIHTQSSAYLCRGQGRNIEDHIGEGSTDINANNPLSCHLSTLHEYPLQKCYTSIAKIYNNGKMCIRQGVYASYSSPLKR